MRIIKTLLFLALTSSVLAIDTPISRVANMEDGGRVSDIEWWQGASVEYSVTFRNDNSAIDLTDAVPIWRAWLETDPTNLYIVSTGTVSSATEGEVTFNLTAGQANLTNQTYLSVITVYTDTGYTQAVAGAYSELDVNYSPVAAGIPQVAGSPIYPSVLNQLTDVDSVDAPTTGHLLSWNGTSWTNSAPAASGVTNVISSDASVVITSGTGTTQPDLSVTNYVIGYAEPLSVTGYSTNFTPTDFDASTNLVVTHSLSEQDVVIQVYDNDVWIIPDTITLTGTGTATVSLVSFPTATGTVVVASSAASTYVDPFVPADLVASNLTVQHNFGAKEVIVQVYDESDNYMIPDSITWAGVNSVTIGMQSYLTTTGTVVIVSGN